MTPELVAAVGALFREGPRPIVVARLQEAYHVSTQLTGPGVAGEVLVLRQALKEAYVRNRELTALLQGVLSTLDLARTDMPPVHAGVITGAFVVDEPAIRKALKDHTPVEIQ